MQQTIECTIFKIGYVSAEDKGWRRFAKNKGKERLKMMSRGQRRAIILSAILLLLFADRNTSAVQQVSPAGDLVKLNMLVLDAQNQPVPGVQQESVSVREDGDPQTITHFSKEEVPLKYCLVVDNSGSMRRAGGQDIDAAKLILNHHKSGDEVAIVRFKDQAELELGFTPDKAAAAARLDSMRGKLSRQTALIDATYLATQYVAKERPDSLNSRRALILITDGVDGASYYNLEDLRKEIEKENIQVFAIGLDLEGANKLPGFDNKSQGKWLLKEITKESGGLAMFPKDEAEVQKAADGIMAMLRAEYVVGYQSTHKRKKGSHHNIKVSLRDVPGHEKRNVITRDEYIEK